MQKGKDTFQKGTRWVVGRNSELSFWFDNWCSDGPLRSLVQGPLPLEEEKLKVKEVVTVSGWNWSKISIPLLDNVSTKLKATPVSLAARGQDRLSWGMSTHGGFELKSAYKLAIGGGEGSLLLLANGFGKLISSLVFKLLCGCAYIIVLALRSASQGGGFKWIQLALFVFPNRNP